MNFKPRLETNTIPTFSRFIFIVASNHSAVFIVVQRPPVILICILFAQMRLISIFMTERSEGKHWKLTSLSTCSRITMCNLWIHIRTGAEPEGLFTLLRELMILTLNIHSLFPMEWDNMNLEKLCMQITTVTLAFIFYSKSEQETRKFLLYIFFFMDICFYVPSCVFNLKDILETPTYKT